jgi:hypothetical protein
MNSEGDLKIQLEPLDDGGVLANIIVTVGDTQSGLQLNGDTPAAAKEALRTMLLEDLNNLLDGVFANYETEAPVEMEPPVINLNPSSALSPDPGPPVTLQCSHCTEIFVAQFPKSQPAIIACPYPECGGTIIVEEYEEVF